MNAETTTDCDILAVMSKAGQGRAEEKRRGEETGMSEGWNCECAVQEVGSLK